MVHWADIPTGLQDVLNTTRPAPFERSPWVAAPQLIDARVAILTTAAIHRADDRPFTGHEGDYRIIPGDVDYSDLAMTHSSVNFGRSAYQQDVNVCFPLEHLHALAGSGEIRSVAKWHSRSWGRPRRNEWKWQRERFPNRFKGTTLISFF